MHSGGQRHRRPAGIHNGSRRGGQTGSGHLAQAFLDAVRVPDPHGDHAERLAGMLSGVLQDQVDDRADLGGRAVGIGGRVPPGQNVLQDAAAADAGEGGQGPVVDVCVGECDEPFIAASVVPAQHAEPRQRTQRVRCLLEFGYRLGRWRFAVLCLI
jgi:hypothetical protein